MHPRQTEERGWKGDLDLVDEAVETKVDVELYLPPNHTRLHLGSQPGLLDLLIEEIGEKEENPEGR